MGRLGLQQRQPWQQLPQKPQPLQTKAITQQGEAGGATFGDQISQWWRQAQGQFGHGKGELVLLISADGLAFAAAAE